MATNLHFTDLCRMTSLVQGEEGGDYKVFCVFLEPFCADVLI